MKNNLEYFKKVKKGKVKIINNETIEWTLGNMILLFNFDSREVTVQIFWEKYSKELTHIHVDYDEIEKYIKAIDNPEKVIYVKSNFLIDHFNIIDKSQMKKQNSFRYYSI